MNKKKKFILLRFNTRSTQSLEENFGIKYGCFEFEPVPSTNNNHINTFLSVATFLIKSASTL